MIGHAVSWRKHGVLSETQKLRNNVLARQYQAEY